MLIPAAGDRPWIMGVVNVTPDSFSDGGQYLDTDAAIRHGLDLVAAGAHVIDVGGESTRPGAHRVDAATERARVIPVIDALAGEGVMCSVDTSRASVAAAAAEAGAAIINDVSGGMADPGMVPTVAETSVPWIVMHWRGPSDVMNSLARYDDAPADVRDELMRRIEVAAAAGIDERRLIIDPGLGFAKTAEHNWQVLRGLDLLTDLGLPVLIGASRKRFLGELLADAAGTLRPANQREVATAAISLLCAQRGVWAVRVHDVTPTRDVLATWARADTRPVGAIGPVQARDAAPTMPLIDADRLPAGGHRRRSAGVAAGVARAIGTAAVPPSGDSITLRGLVVRGHHGVFAHEKRDGQDFVIDISLDRDLTAAARADDVAATVNYAELAELAEAIVGGPARDLIETVAVEIAETILSRCAVRSVAVTVHKPQAPIPGEFEDVAVTVRRDGHRDGQAATLP